MREARQSLLRREEEVEGIGVIALVRVLDIRAEPILRDEYLETRYCDAKQLAEIDSPVCSGCCGRSDAPGRSGMD